MTIERVAIVGAGIMGSGIARAILKQKLKVKLYDVEPERTKEAVQEIRESARRIDPDNLSGCDSLEELCEGSDLIIEAVVEDLDVKCELFKRLGCLAPGETIFASNTSSLSISRMAEASGRPGRFAGLHFFNPAFLMRLVEFITHPGLEEAPRSALEQFLLKIKKRGIKCRESPGFIVNRILIPMVNEAVYLLEEVAEKGEDRLIKLANRVDSAIVKENILLIGAYDLIDLTGLDTINRVARVIYEGFGRNPRYIPSPLLEGYLAEGRRGRKSGRGIYHYNNRQNDPDNNPPLDARGCRLVKEEEPAFDTTLLVAVIVNEAFRVLEEGIVESYRDIEECMELGTRWPKGPFALAKAYGLKKLHHTLKARYESRSELPRYEPSPLFTALPPELAQFFRQE